MGRLSKCCVLMLPLLVAAVSLSSCTKKITRPITEAPHFVASPDTLSLADGAPAAVAYLSTDAPGALRWRVTGKPSWITATPESGQVTQSLTQVSIAGDPRSLAPGIHGGTVVFHSEGGEERVFVRFSVDEHPQAGTSVSSLHFDAHETLESFTLTNQGTGLLIWSVSSSDETWLLAGPPSGVLGGGQSTLVYATASRAGRPPGTLLDTLHIASNSQGGPIAIPVTADVAATPLLETSPDTLRFDYFVDARSLRIWNPGNAPLDWTAAASQPNVQLASTGGTVAAGETTTVAVTVDRDGLANGNYLSYVTVSAGSLPAKTIWVSLRHFLETKWLIGETFTDAEYDRAHDRIVAVGGGASPRLFVLDPEARTKASVALPLPAACVSIRPDGLYAAAGHDGVVSLVDLTTMVVERTYSVTTNAIDVVLPSNGWVYVFPRTDQWETIRCVRLSDGAETLHSGRSIRAGTLVRLHPSGDFIYGANNGLSPSDIEKYDIRPGTATYLSDSPYHGDYAFNGNLWISDDGQRIFARSGNAFRSTTGADDMTYNGNLANSTNLQWVEHSSAASRVFCLLADPYSGGEPPAELRVYNASFLAYLGAYPLPPFLVPNGSGGGTLHSSKGRFAFANAAGTRVHVLLKAADGSGLLEDWAAVRIDVSALP